VTGRYPSSVIRSMCRSNSAMSTPSLAATFGLNRLSKFAAQHESGIQRHAMDQAQVDKVGAGLVGGAKALAGFVHDPVVQVQADQEWVRRTSPQGRASA